jgi:F0F1-type ATP synthase assembly protein I
MDSDKLEKKLLQAKAKIAEKEKLRKNITGNYSGKIVVDIISGLAVGVFFGYFVDIALGTTPLMLVILMIIGPMVGLYNFYKDYLKELNKENDRSDT